MRSIGRLPNEDLAATFNEVLEGHGIGNSIRNTGDGDWEVWVDSEDQLDQARGLLERFVADPGRGDFSAAVDQARLRKRVEVEAKKQDRHKVVDRRQMFPSMDRSSFGRLTLAMIIISVLVAVVSQLGEDLTHIRVLFITDIEPFGDRVRFSTLFLPEVLSGQVWRLVTPMFIHFGIMHVLFNMLWLKDLGSMIERVHGTLVFALMVVTMAVASNMAQYLMSTPLFGGMSGVVYGLLGYIWLRGRLDPGRGLFINKSTMIMMLIWFVACWTGVLGPIANWAHTAGLVVGLGWGGISGLIARR